jgi:hypothetical protein
VSSSPVTKHGAHARPLSLGGGPPGDATSSPSEFNHVAVGVGHVGEPLAVRVLASPDQPSPSPLNRLDSPAEILLVDEPKAEVPDSTALARPILGRGALPERNRVRSPWRPEENHPLALPKDLLHPEDALIEPEGLVEVPNGEVEVGEAFRPDRHSPFSSESKPRLRGRRWPDAPLSPWTLESTRPRARRRVLSASLVSRNSP